MDEVTSLEFAAKTTQEISLKCFLHTSDRVVALGIVQGFMARRTLADGIRGGQLQTVRAQLQLLDEKNLLENTNIFSNGDNYSDKKNTSMSRFGIKWHLNHILYPHFHFNMGSGTEY